MSRSSTARWAMSASANDATAASRDGRAPSSAALASARRRKRSTCCVSSSASFSVRSGLQPTVMTAPPVGSPSRSRTRWLGGKTFMTGPPSVESPAADARRVAAALVVAERAGLVQVRERERCVPRRALADVVPVPEVLRDARRQPARVLAQGGVVDPDEAPRQGEGPHEVVLLHAQVRPVVRERVARVARRVGAGEERARLERVARAERVPEGPLEAGGLEARQAGARPAGGDDERAEHGAVRAP